MVVGGDGFVTFMECQINQVQFSNEIYGLNPAICVKVSTIEKTSQTKPYFVWVFRDYFLSTITFRVAKL